MPKNKSVHVYKTQSRVEALMVHDGVVVAQMREDAEGKKGSRLVPISEFERPDDLRVGQGFMLEVSTTYTESSVAEDD